MAQSHFISPKRRVSRRQAIKAGFVSLAAAPVLPGLLQSTLRAADAAGSRTPAVVTVHPEADAAALDALAAGGNAIDAAVAAMLVLGVLFPQLTGIGGYGGSMMVYLAGKKRMIAIDSDSRAPLAYKPGLLRDSETAFHGYLAMGVPGVVGGMDYALRHYGKLSWKDVIKHAQKLAGEGFVVDQRLATALKTVAPLMDPVSFKAYFPDGQPPAPGSRRVQSDLARLLGDLGDGGADAFYRGEIAKKIVQQIRENGGILTEEDFKQYKALEMTPDHIQYRGTELFTPPPPSGGLTSLSILKTIEQFDVPGMKPWSAEYYDLFAQASKLCWAERFSEFGDPDDAKFSARKLLSVEKAKSRAQLIRDHKVPDIDPPPAGPKHTANVVIVDKDRNMVSYTATQGGAFGSRVVIAGLGLVLGHGMSRFTLEPGSPNAPAPGKRMQHNMSPILGTKDGSPLIAVGMPGGRMIVTVSTHLAAGALDFKAPADEVVNSPRVHSDGGEPLSVSPNMPESVVKALEAMGHHIEIGRVAGPSNLAVVGPESVDYSAGRTLPPA